MNTYSVKLTGKYEHCPKCKKSFLKTGKENEECTCVCDTCGKKLHYNYKLPDVSLCKCSDYIRYNLKYKKMDAYSVHPKDSQYNLCSNLCSKCGRPFYDDHKSTATPLLCQCLNSNENLEAKKGWICPKCGSGVNPNINVCPCNDIK